MFNIIIYGALCAALVFGGISVWSGFTGSYVAKGAAAQLAADKPAIDAALRRAEAAEADSAAMAVTLEAQTLAVKAASERAEAASKAARSLSIQYAEAVAASSSRTRQLRSAAVADPVKRNCEAELSETDRILTESLNLTRKP